MKRKEGLQKLGYLIKELNDTHGRLQNANENMQQIEAALLNQQVLAIYGHIQGLMAELMMEPSPVVTTPKKEEVQATAPSRSAVDRKKALLKSIQPEPQSETKSHVRNNEEEEEEEYIEEVPSLSIEEINTDAPEETPYAAPHIPEEEPEEEEEEIAPEESKLNKTPSQPAHEISLHEKLGIKHEPSLNEKFTSLGGKQNLADKLKLTPIKDLKSAIGINQKVTFINTLFKGSDKDFKNAISSLNNFGNYQEAKTYIASNLSSKHGWDEQNETVAEFMQLVQRRFM